MKDGDKTFPLVLKYRDEISIGISKDFLGATCVKAHTD